jgi:hypothetical protein
MQASALEVRRKYLPAEGNISKRVITGVVSKDMIVPTFSKR